MITVSVKNMRILHVVEGLAEGLSAFSGPSRVALLYAEGPRDPIRVYDPQNLLVGHEPKFKELYLDSEVWRTGAPVIEGLKLFGQIHHEKNLGLAGLISYGGRTRSIFYQMWFTEHHPDMCSIGPTERWLEQAVCLLSHDFATEDVFYSGTSKYVLEEYATHAVRDFLYDLINVLLGWDMNFRVYPLLYDILNISKTNEEGFPPQGMLVILQPRTLSEIDFLIRFPESERPHLRNAKHVRKLLSAVEESDRKLISDGERIIGIAGGALPEIRMTADFRGGYGFLRLAGSPVCSFSDGKFQSTTRKPNLVQFEEALLEFSPDAFFSNELYRIVVSIAAEAGEHKHGCTIVVDLNEVPLDLAGQKLEYPVDLRADRHLALAQSLSRVDGALHVGRDFHLHGFACLLDGHSVAEEDRSRGARFNSALRFTAEHRNIIVVVVSADRPVSVIENGRDLTVRRSCIPVSRSLLSPPTLAEWLEQHG